MIDINELRKLAQAATPGPWIAKNVSGAGLEIYMSHPVYPDKDWPAFGTDSAFCKKGLVSYETWTQFPHEVRDAQQSINARFIAAANPAAISELLDRLETAEKERDQFKTDWLECLRIAEEAEPIMKRQRAEIDSLQARVDAMEHQEPVAWIRGRDNHRRRKLSFEKPAKSSPDKFHWAPLYALPGAKGE